MRQSHPQQGDPNRAGRALPAAIRRTVGIREGDLAAVTTDGGVVTLVPMSPLDDSQTHFWTTLWQ